MGMQILKKSGLRRWMNAALADNPVGMWVPGVNQSGTTLRSCSPRWTEKIIKSAPVAWWRLGETSGTTAIDRIGGRNGVIGGNPTLGNSTLLGNDPSTSIDLDGSGDYVSVAYNSSLNPAAMTIFGWFMREVDTAGTERLVYSFGSNKGYAISINSSDVVTFTVGTGAGTTAATGTTATVVGTKYSFACVSNGTTSTLYVNGVQESTLGAVYVPNDSFATEIGMGSSANYFNGRMQDIVMWDRALGADEIADLHLAGAATHAATLTGGVISGVRGPHSGPSQALDYDGTTGYLTIPYARGLNPLSALTVEAWYSPDELTSTGEIFSSRGGAGTTGYTLYKSDNDLNFRMYKAAAAQVTVLKSDGLTSGYQHICGVYDGTSLTLLRNGVVVQGPTALGAAHVPTTSGNARIGSNSLTVSNLINGQIAGVAIYRTNLTTAQVLEHCNAGR